MHPIKTILQRVTYIVPNREYAIGFEEGVNYYANKLKLTFRMIEGEVIKGNYFQLKAGINKEASFITEKIYLKGKENNIVYFKPEKEFILNQIHFINVSNVMCINYTLEEI